MKNETPNKIQTDSATGTAVRTPKKKLGKPAIIIIAITAVLVLVVAFVGFLIFRKYDNIQKQQAQLNTLYPTVDVGNLFIADGDDDTGVPAESEEIDAELGIISSFEELHKINEDVIGFVRIPDSQLSTPVVQGTDNIYYLDHDYYKQNALGIPFADANAKIKVNEQSMNITIYGHSARDGSYFAPLKDFTTVDYYKTHPVLTFDTIYGRGTYKVVGAFIAKVKNTDTAEADPEWFNYHSYIDMAQSDFDTFISEIKKRSYFNTGVDVAYGDQFVTLSTCDTEIIPSGDTPYRMVVVARKVRAGEGVSVDVSKATANTEMVMPKAWQDKYKKVNPYK